MCATMNENEGDAIQAYAGNKSAGLRFRKALREIEILCLEMRNALFEQPLRKSAVRRRKYGEVVEGAENTLEDGKEDGVDGQSDEGGDDFNDDDLDRDADSDLEGNNGENLRRSPIMPMHEVGGEVHEYQFLKKDAEVGDRTWLQRGPVEGLQNLISGVRVDLDGQRPNLTQTISPLGVTATISPQLTPHYEGSKWPPAVSYLDGQ